MTTGCVTAVTPKMSASCGSRDVRSRYVSKSKLSASSLHSRRVSLSPDVSRSHKSQLVHHNPSSGSGWAKVTRNCRSRLHRRQLMERSLAVGSHSIPSDNDTGKEKARVGIEYNALKNTSGTPSVSNRGAKSVARASASVQLDIAAHRDVMLEEFAQNLREEGMKNIQRCKIFFSDVTAVPRRWIMGRKFAFNDYVYSSIIATMHVGTLVAPFFFNWSALGAFFVMYFITGCLGITLSYHRQLSHKSFTTPKWLEYCLAYCGALAMQGDPAEWVSSHRHHHKNCDTPKDPHSPYEGFWWSHIGWVLDFETTISRVGDRSNAIDMAKQPFYTWLCNTYVLHMIASMLALYALGGLPFVLWGGCVRVCWVYHVTWAVNSAAHVWGNQQYNTGDLSRNNWWVGILAWGEGWHNNHHAFEYSARHGLEWYQVDMTWGVIQVLKTLGLAKNVKLPSELQKRKLRIA